MKYLAPLAILLSLAACNANKQHYVNGVDELPVPNGFVEKESSNSSFDTVSGRIVDVVYEGKGSLDNIKKYYEDTLPELGWKKQTLNLYKREEETLQLKMERNGGNTILLNFVIRPSVD